MYGATTVKEEILFRKEDDEKKLKTLSGEQNRLNNYKTLPEEYRMNNKKGWILHLKLWLHCLIIPSFLFIISLELWYPESIVFLGLFLGLAWMYFFGGQMAKKIIELKKLQ